MSWGTGLLVSGSGVAGRGDTCDNAPFTTGCTVRLPDADGGHRHGALTL